MPGRRARAVLAANVLAALGIVACYDPPEPDCGFFCGSGSACPSDYACGADQRCHRSGTPEGECASEFAVANAQSTSVTTVLVTFTDAPDPVTGGEPANYAIAGLSISDSPPVVEGNTVTLTTTGQVARLYTLQVANVTRLSDGQPLEQGVASFAGRSAFNLVGATAPDANTIDLEFDAPPAPVQVFCLNNYMVGLPVLGAQLDMNTVELATGVQGGDLISIAVSNVVRASDDEPLSNAMTLVQTRSPFTVLAASASDAQDVVITFSDPPQPATAMLVSSYVIDDPATNTQLAIAGVVSVVGQNVTLHTAAQSAVSYQLGVTGVVRGLDGEMLQAGQSSATFTGIAP